MQSQQRLTRLLLGRAEGVLFCVGILSGIALFSAASPDSARAALPGLPPQGLGSQIVCQVFTDLNQVGPPMPVFDADCQNPPPAAQQCADGLDNDNDGLIDLSDPGCSNGGDNDEFNSPPPAAQCANGLDDDEDGLIDSADPGCHTDGNAQNTPSYSASDTDESNIPVPPTAQCADGTDNDSDGLADIADPGCHTDFNASNTASYDPARNNEAATAPPADTGEDNTPAPTAQCADGADNDGDGLIDLSDPGCTNTSDTDEANPAGGGENTPAPPAPASGGGGGGGGGGVLIGFLGTTSVSAGVVLGTSTVSCDKYFTDFIRAGRQNNPEQVNRLQRVLRDFEGATTLAVNGIYDAKTLTALITFQSKYASEVLTPWGIDKPTGYVFLTTRKKLNEVYCKGTKQFPLTAAEEQYVQNLRAAAGLLSVVAPPATPKTPATLKVTNPAAPQPAAARAALTGGELFVATSTKTEESGGWWGSVQNLFRRAIRR